MTGHNKETSLWRGSIECEASHAQLTRRGQLVSHESSSETGSRERVREAQSCREELCCGVAVPRGKTADSTCCFWW